MAIGKLQNMAPVKYPAPLRAHLKLQWLQRSCTEPQPRMTLPTPQFGHRKRIARPAYFNARLNVGISSGVPVVLTPTGIAWCADTPGTG